MSTWEDFFARLDTLIVSPPTHVSVIVELSRQLGGPVRRAVPRMPTTVLYSHDVVAPIVMRGQDIATTADRKKLLALRVEEANTMRLLDKGILREILYI